MKRENINPLLVEYIKMKYIPTDDKKDFFELVDEIKSDDNYMDIPFVSEEEVFKCFKYLTFNIDDLKMVYCYKIYEQ